MTTTTTTLIVRDTKHYGWVFSIHHSREAAESALERQARRVRRRYPDAIISEMYALIDGRPGRKGERVRIS